MIPGDAPKSLLDAIPSVFHARMLCVKVVFRFSFRFNWSSSGDVGFVSLDPLAT